MISATIATLAAGAGGLILNNHKIFQAIYKNSGYRKLTPFPDYPKGKCFSLLPPYPGPSLSRRVGWSDFKAATPDTTLFRKALLNKFLYHPAARDFEAWQKKQDEAQKKFQEELAAFQAQLKEEDQVEGKTSQPGFQDVMDLEEAYEILNIPVSDRNDLKKVQAALRRVILRNHPDRGGSPFLATKINEAKALIEATPMQNPKQTAGPKGDKDHKDHK